MMPSTTAATGSAERWGRAWGARAEDWARDEEQQVPTYKEALRRVALEPGQRVLDIGCGSGVFLRLAVDRGAKAFGLDASEALIEISRRRVREADLRVGEMQFLPYEDDSFDLVTGFNAFFFAADMTAVLREAGRVAKPGAPVVMQVWGRPDRCDLEAMKVIVRPFLPPPPPGAPPAPQLWKPGVLEAMAAEAGLTPEAVFDTSWAYHYRGDEELGRGMMAPAGLGELVGPSKEEAVKAEVAEALARYRTADGGYRLENEYHYLIARA
jgi:SAM-dependent methyltransferase